MKKTGFSSGKIKILRFGYSFNSKYLYDNENQAKSVQRIFALIESIGTGKNISECYKELLISLKDRNIYGDGDYDIITDYYDTITGLKIYKNESMLITLNKETYKKLLDYIEIVLENTFNKLNK